MGAVAVSSMSNPALRSMVAFDIETRGLNPLVPDAVTCVCFHDGLGLSETHLFKATDPEEDLRTRERVLARLDSAPRLCAFNGVRFDIPFLCKAWGISSDRAGEWVRKTVDVFEACKLGVGRTFGLNRLLEINGMESKTGTGRDAIRLAEAGEWDKLGAYCMQDTRLTHLVSCQHQIALPLHTPSQRRLVLQTLHPQSFVLW